MDEPVKFRSSRIRELDSLRGLAACTVLLHHNLAAAGLLKGPFRDLLIASPLHVIESGRPAVLLFFVLSGYVLTRALSRTELTRIEFTRWVLQRSVRLLVPSAAALLISAVLYTLASRGTWPGEAAWLRNTLWNSALSWRSIGNQAALVAPDGGFGLDNVLWSLEVEWRVSLFLPFVAIPLIFSGNRGSLYLLLAGVGVACFAGGASPDDFYSGASALGATRVTIYFTLPFIIGVVLERSGASRVRADRALIACGLLAIIGLARANSDLAIFAASALLIWLAQQPGLLRRVLLHPVLTWLGTVSFSLYLIHEPVLAALHHSLHGRISTAVIFALSVAAALPAAWLFYAGVERPAHRLARFISQIPCRLGHR